MTSDKTLDAIYQGFASEDILVNGEAFKLTKKLVAELTQAAASTLNNPENAFGLSWYLLELAQTFDQTLLEAFRSATNPETKAMLAYVLCHWRNPEGIEWAFDHFTEIEMIVFFARLLSAIDVDRVNQALFSCLKDGEVHPPEIQLSLIGILYNNNATPTQASIDRVHNYFCNLVNTEQDDSKFVKVSLEYLNATLILKVSIRPDIRTKMMQNPKVVRILQRTLP